ncbi:hypothetical protein [Mycobacteroides abscessus]|uniref:hypothetical protein n=1 Tax=Mycobacteroides abscessus TaxID=36809 RepID=UPI00092815EC|nr:hypothetical protein [Mycobacteroides abscessus]SHP52856.1 Uncharacterised protein [Mycobacteroides abscessus subsp. abscessus]
MTTTEGQEPIVTRELISRMRLAADALEDATAVRASIVKEHKDTGWDPSGLRLIAQGWEYELDKDEVIEQLTQRIAEFMTQSVQYDRVARERATPIAHLVYASFDVKLKSGRS